MGGTNFQNVGLWCVQIAARKDDSARLYVLPTTTAGMYAALVARSSAPHALLAPLTEEELLGVADSGFSERRLESEKLVQASFGEFPRAGQVNEALGRFELALAEPVRLPPAIEARCRRAPLEF